MEKWHNHTEIYGMLKCFFIADLKLVIKLIDFISIYIDR